MKDFFHAYVCAGTDIQLVAVGKEIQLMCGMLVMFKFFFVDATNYEK
jgi:hypothetical protein